VPQLLDGVRVGGVSEALPSGRAKRLELAAEVAHGRVGAVAVRIGEVCIGSRSIIGENKRPRPGFREGVGEDRRRRTPVSW
jgi:hypothetical protein